ncbi:ABC transporter permease [Leptolyngbya sp. 'hensonii']|uniref:ABC transporter permease n=1 Tax=Leptolyngbya sp. 'hensonii' TaxID=1922337 RepID=UPI000950019A|nr:ABC transporter permease [Leptolyngbya sp. 'hensonii']OLP18230.1 ABC transporter permease [Leptolyngbya sp. 'hensonii']
MHPGSTLQKSLLKNLAADVLTIFWGDWLDLRVRLVQVVSSGLVSPLIYILAFGLGLGSSIRPGAGIDSSYGSYLEFMLPGMVALSSMVISFGGTTFSICGDRLFSKTFEELLLVPVHPLGLFLGKMLAGVVRGLLTAASVLLVAILATGKLWSFLNPLFLLLLVLNCAVFAGLGVIVGLKVKSLESVGIFNNFLIVPMSFLGATFFDPAQLPLGLKPLVYLLPLTYTSIGLRAAAYQPLAQFPWYSIPVLLTVAIILSALGARLFAQQQD